MKKRESGMSEESRNILLSLVERYEKGHGELQRSINEVGVNLIEVKADIKYMNSRIEDLAKRATANEGNISKLQRAEIDDESLRKRLETMLSNANRIYIPVLIALILSAIYGVWEFIKTQIRISK